MGLVSTLTENQIVHFEDLGHKLVPSLSRPGYHICALCDALVPRDGFGDPKIRKPCTGKK